MNYLLIGVFLVIIVFGFWKLFSRLSEGVHREFSFFEGYFVWLYEKGFEDGVLVLTHKNSEVFFQFEKYVLSKNKSGLELSIPKLSWNEHLISKIEKLSNDSNFGTRLVEGSDGMIFLNIDFEDSPQDAFTFSKVLNQEVFKISSKDLFHAILRGISVSEH